MISYNKLSELNNIIFNLWGRHRKQGIDIIKIVRGIAKFYSFTLADGCPFISLVIKCFVRASIERFFKNINNTFFLLIIRSNARLEKTKY